MALITVDFYEDRYGTGTETQIEAFIDDVTAEIVDYATEIGITAEWGIESTDTEAPAAVKAVCARVVNRAIGNPYGISQEGLGDHQRTFTVGAAGGMLSPKDKRIIRRAVGLDVGGIAGLEVDLPLPAEYDETSELV